MEWRVKIYDVLLAIRGKDRLFKIKGIRNETH